MDAGGADPGMARKDPVGNGGRERPASESASTAMLFNWPFKRDDDRAARSSADGRISRPVNAVRPEPVEGSPQLGFDRPVLSLVEGSAGTVFKRFAGRMSYQ